MKLQTTIEAFKIKVTEEQINDVYFIEQSAEHGNKFYIESENGYSSYEAGVFYNSIESALKQVKNLIKNYFIDRGEEEPKGW